MTSSAYHSLLPEINAHRRDESGVKDIVRVLVQETGLSDARVADEQELEQIVIVDCATHHRRVVVPGDSQKNCLLAVTELYFDCPF